MSTSNIFDLVDLWNDAAVTFNGIKLNVTDTASDPASNLLDLQVGGVSRFRVKKGGTIHLSEGTNTGATYFLTGVGGSNSIFFAGFGTTATVGLGVNSFGPFLRGTASLSWTSGVINASPDLSLSRDAADTLAQRRSTNAQTFNLYNTFSDASNHERARLGWAGNVFEIKPQAEGTGTVRTLHISGLPTSDPAINGVLWNDAGTVKVSAG